MYGIKEELERRIQLLSRRDSISDESYSSGSYTCSVLSTAEEVGQERKEERGMGREITTDT
jgi:hypothetical protein